MALKPIKECPRFQYLLQTFVVPLTSFLKSEQDSKIIFAVLIYVCSVLPSLHSKTLSYNSQSFAVLSL